MGTMVKKGSSLTDDCMLRLLMTLSLMIKQYTNDQNLQPKLQPAHLMEHQIFPQ